MNSQNYMVKEFVWKMVDQLYRQGLEPDEIKNALLNCKNYINEGTIEDEIISKDWSMI